MRARDGNDRNGYSGYCGGGSNMMQNISNDNRKSVRIDKAVNIEHFHNEDEIDIAILSREIRREITALL